MSKKEIGLNLENGNLDDNLFQDLSPIEGSTIAGGFLPAILPSAAALIRPAASAAAATGAKVVGVGVATGLGAATVEIGRGIGRRIDDGIFG